ncbi:hypothetical protein JOM56_005572 [Amanita muscaria]
MSQTQDNFDSIDHPDGPQGGQGNNPQGPGTEGQVTRRGKTHGNARILEMLRALPRAAVIEQNLLINARNRKRKRTRAYNNLAEAASSDESLITLPDEDPAPAPPQQSLTLQASALLSSLSPNSAKKWLKNC